MFHHTAAQPLSLAMLHEESLCKLNPWHNLVLAIAALNQGKSTRMLVGKYCAAFLGLRERRRLPRYGKRRPCTSRLAKETKLSSIAENSMLCLADA